MNDVLILHLKTIFFPLSPSRWCALGI